MAIKKRSKVLRGWQPITTFSEFKGIWATPCVTSLTHQCVCEVWTNTDSLIVLLVWLIQIKHTVSMCTWQSGYQLFSDCFQRAVSLETWKWQTNIWHTWQSLHVSDWIPGKTSTIDLILDSTPVYTDRTVPNPQLATVIVVAFLRGFI